MIMSKSMPATERDVLVIKLGGSIVYRLSEEFLSSLVSMKEKYEVIVVHGGGPEMTNTLKRLDIETVFIDGQRKTTMPVLEVAEMILKGKVNSYLTNQLNHHGVKAVGLCGYDAGLLKASLIDEKNLGLVGEINEVNTPFLIGLISSGYLPVIAPLSCTAEGDRVNVNADLAAAAIAREMKAEKLLYVTDVPGILHEGKVVQETDTEQIGDWIDSGVISGGMIPKVKSALSVLAAGMKEVMIVGGQQEIFQDGKFIGTKMTNKGEVATT
ncbi:acetylglutamate kinase [Rossellomorea aquimaris]|uniref:acetylglutamate kinase n=1 Tax=Rossellomorea aquimaris TaxID=189382 RepID=UPI001CD65EE0|nr:acetylglutamate kinase [Rossellomorea aquimaris]MCA1056149.1 acetylglutamate kinase [Rossellomorea aquimaris]